MSSNHTDDRGVQAIRLGHMPHQAFICEDGEDWAGITNQKERRRLQNRLNQRAREYDHSIVPPLFGCTLDSNIRVKADQKLHGKNTRRPIS
ncbi:hypothetical protein IMZ48_45235 [Candidatus Bathyarchaeota archaeon]|nr:hypothetical protein [Candidatus Bathyarchaeota archaeon]